MNNKLILIVLGLVLLSLFIAIGDYFWYGKKLIGNTPLSKKDIIFFYFTRTLSEFIGFIIGLIVALNLNN